MVIGTFQEGFRWGPFEAREANYGTVDGPGGPSVAAILGPGDRF